MKNKFLGFLIISILLIVGVNIAFAATHAERILQSAVAKINSANGVSAKFVIKSQKHSISGKFQAHGKKFKLTLPNATTWYDGKDMWTLSEATGEVTLVTPDSQEIAEINPFSYLNSYSRNYNIYKSKREDKNNHLILLNPKSKKSDIKAVEVAISKKSLLPVRFIIRDKNDTRTEIQVSELNLSAKNNDSDFKYDSKAHSDCKVIDLR